MQVKRVFLAILIAAWATNGYCGVHKMAPLDLTGTIWDTARTGPGKSVDPVLLYAIALRETRRPGAQPLTAVPDPFVIRHGSDVYRLETLAEAEAKLAEILESERNLRTLDLGIMQVNAFWHGNRVDDLKKLLIPAISIQVASHVASEAIASTTDVVLGIGRYHSYTEKLAIPYGQHVAEMACQMGWKTGQSIC